MMVGVASATFQEQIIWDPNGNLGTFTDPTANFATILTQLGASATITVSGGGTALVTAVAGASSGDVIEITDNATYDGGIVITDKTDIVIRAAAGASPIIDCGVLSLGVTCLKLDATSDRAVSNIGIKGLTFIDIRFNAGGSAATGHGIASFSGTILENIVIEDNVFDNTDPSKTQDFKGSAIHLNKVDGLLISRNTILNSSMHFSTSPQEDGAITIHEFLRQPNFLNNVFIQNNEILFDYSQMSGTTVAASTRGIVLAHTGKTTTKFNNVVVEYNLIDNVQKEGIKVFGTSTDGSDDETTHVSNNVIKRTANGIEIDAGAVLIDRTIFDDQTTTGPESKNEAINADGGATTVTNTIVIEKTKGVAKSGSATVTITCIDLFNASSPDPTNNAGGTETNVDPEFVDTSVNDYTIGNATFPAGCAGGDFGLELIPPAIPLDHFLLYDVKITKDTPKFEKQDVTLADQFGTGTFEVEKVERLGNPANKNGGGIIDSETHYVSYKIKRAKDEPKHEKIIGILVENQFGEISVDTKKPDRLLVPSAKNLDNPVPPLNVDAEHFKCYKVKVTEGTPEFEPIQVTLADQFEDKLFDVKKPERLCTPVDKDDAGIINLDAHLLCYKVKRAEDEPKHEKVKGIHINNQFGPLQIDTKKETELCVPSTKTLP